jgi:hypothetical protein
LRKLSDNRWDIVADWRYAFSSFHQVFHERLASKSCG